MAEPRIAEGYKPGYFLSRLVKNGPLMPARIWRPCTCTVQSPATMDEMLENHGRWPAHDWDATCDRYPPLVAEIAGQPADLDRVWNSRNVITKAEFRYRTDTATWDRANDPDAPAASPDQSIDLMTVKPLF